MRIKSASTVAALTILVACQGAAAGPDWVEAGDAGSLLGTAQVTVGVGAIHSITGTLNGGTLAPDFEDMYLIQVLDPATFSLSVQGADFDAQLFIFNITMGHEAFGLLANDNNPFEGNGPLLTRLATDDSGAKIAYPGLYAIAISAAGRYPVSVRGEIFHYSSPTEISGPDGPGGINPHIDWAGSGPGGAYSIDVTGVGFYQIPAPGSLGVLGFGVLLCVRRRR